MSDNREVIKKFLSKKAGHTPYRDIPYSWKNRNKGTYRGCTLTSTGRELINYNTVIAYFTSDNELMINTSRYSMSTSHIQSHIKNLAYLNNINYTEYKVEGAKI